MDRIVCSWCGGQSPPDAANCLSCGAQLNVEDLVSDSGWRETPRLKDMSEVRFGNSVCQVEGEIVPEHPGGAWRSAVRKLWAQRCLWARLTGPGRVAIQSHYERWEDPDRPVCAMAPEGKVRD